MPLLQIWMSSPALKAVLDAGAAKDRVEPCGALFGYRVPLGAEVLEAVRVKNAHPSPDRAFLLDPLGIVEAARAARAKGLDLVGFWHGHLDGPAWPGMLDEEGMRAVQSDSLAPYAHVVVGRGTTGKRVIRAFRPGRSRPKQVRLTTLRRPRGAPAAPPTRTAT